MSWQVLTTRTSDPDFDAVAVEARDAVDDELFTWVEHGPPRRSPRLFAGVVIYEDRLACGYTVTYFVDEQAQWVAVLKVEEG